MGVQAAEQRGQFPPSPLWAHVKQLYTNPRHTYIGQSAHAAQQHSEQQRIYPVSIGEAAQGIDQRRHVDVTEPAHVLQDVVVHFVLSKTHRGSVPAGTRTEGERSLGAELLFASSLSKLGCQQQEGQSLGWGKSTGEISHEIHIKYR